MNVGEELITEGDAGHDFWMLESGEGKAVAHTHTHTHTHTYTHTPPPPIATHIALITIFFRHNTMYLHGQNASAHLLSLALFAHLSSPSPLPLCSALSARSLHSFVGLYPFHSPHLALSALAPLAADVIVGGKEVFTYGPGTSFGDVALLYDCPRTATIKCKTAGVAWTLHRRKFRYVLAKFAKAQLSRSLDSLRGVALLQDLSDTQLGAVAKAVTVRKFSPGEYIITKGDPGAVFYFLEEGTVDCVDIGADGKGVFTIESGGTQSYFGERALLTNEPRAASVVAKIACTCLALERDDFEGILGKLGDVLKSNLFVRAIGSLPMMADLLPHQLAQAGKHMVEATIDDGECLVTEGQTNISLIVIQDGKVELISKEEEEEEEEENDDAETTEGEKKEDEKKDETEESSAADALMAGILTGSTGATTRIVPSSPTQSGGGDTDEEGEDTLFVTQGKCFGAEEMLTGRAATFTAVAHGTVKYAMLRRDDYIRHVHQSPTPKSRSLLRPDKAGADAAAAAAAARDDAGELVKWENIEFVRPIGEGYFGRVYLSKDKTTDAMYAVKQLQRKMIKEGGFYELLRREKQVMELINHPLATQLVQTHKDKHCYHLVLELVPGGDLFGRLRKAGGKLPFEEVVFYAACIIDILEYMAEQEIAYRDLKVSVWLILE